MYHHTFAIPVQDMSMTVYCWTSTTTPKGVVLILHGMADHALRYDELAQTLSQNGFEVYACDLRGHGQTGQLSGSLGFFADKDGWTIVIKDITKLISKIRADFPSQPLFLLGHSMGSFLVRTLLLVSREHFAGAILCGTSLENVWLLRFSRALTTLLIHLQGPHTKSKLLNYLTFGTFNRSFRPVKTSFDWLSRDEREVDLYCKDPLCGFICTLSFYRDLITGLISINSSDSFKSKQIPLFFLGGTRDPVGHMGKDIPILAGKYTRCGYTDVSYQLYQGARHELFHEIIKGEVNHDILIWLHEHL